MAGYLLVFAPDGARLTPLPERGEVTLGRGPKADVRLDDPSVAPAHLRIECRPGECVAHPVAAGAPVAVNARAIDAPRLLASGDALTLGKVAVVFQQAPGDGGAAAVLEQPAWRRRLQEETSRALRYRRPYALLLLDLGDVSRKDATDAADTVRGLLRTVDIIGWEGTGELAILLPETGVAATVPARRLLQELAPTAAQARIGMALFPDDGTDAHTLLLGARTAARAARPASCAAVADGALRLTIGDRAVILGDPKMRRLFELVEQLGASPLSVLIEGETGVGKEIVAGALHAWSPRRDGPLVSISCAALPETLLESELFGHERGAFSGAHAAKPGLLESADRGTVFLDEIGDCSARTQAELLRVLETRKVRRLGAVVERPIDVRLVAASNRSLADEVAAGRFRQDLYFRIRGTSLVVPPLRDRRLEIPLMARAFLDEARRAQDKPPIAIPPQVLYRLSAYDWPGNVRELRALMEYLAAVVRETALRPDHLPEPVRSAGTHRGREPDDEAADLPGRREATPPPDTDGDRPRPLHEEIADLERRRIAGALAATDGVRVRAAERIGMPLRTLVTKMKLYGLTDAPRGGRTRPDGKQGDGDR